MPNRPFALNERTKRQDGLPPGVTPAHPERFSRWVTSVLHAASTTPEPMGRFCASPRHSPCGDGCCASIPTLQRYACSPDGSAQMVQRANHLLHAGAVMTQQMAQLLVVRPPLRIALPIAGIESRLQVLGRMVEVHYCRALRRQRTEKAPVVARPVGNRHHVQVRALAEHRFELRAERRLQHLFVRLRHPAPIHRLEPLPLGIVERERPTPRLLVAHRPIRPLRVLHRDHHTIKRHRHRHRLIGDFTPFAQRRLDASRCPSHCPPSAFATGPASSSRALIRPNSRNTLSPSCGVMCATTTLACAASAVQ